MGSSDGLRWRFWSSSHAGCCSFANNTQYFSTMYSVHSMQMSCMNGLLLNLQYVEYTTLCMTSYDIPNLMNESEVATTHIISFFTQNQNEKLLFMCNMITRCNTLYLGIVMRSCDNVLST